VKINLKSDLITIQNVYCKYTSNDGVQYSKVVYSDESNRNVSCDIEKKTFSDSIEMVDIQLFMNSSQSLFFDLTFNNETYVFVKNNIPWKTKKIVDPNSLSTELNFNVPFRKQWKYQLNLWSDNVNSTMIVVNCIFISGLNPTCTLSSQYLNDLISIPSRLNFDLYIIQMQTNEIINIGVDFLDFYKTIEFQHIKPFYISYNERLNLPLRIIGNTLISLNSTNYQFACNISQNGTNSISVNATFDLQSNEYQPNLEMNSHFACTFNSFGFKDQDYKIHLEFISKEGIKRVSSNSSRIFVYEKVFNLGTSFYGSNKGGYEIGKIRYDEKYPTINFTEYSFSLKLQDRNIEIPIENSEFNAGGFVFTMIDISKYFKSWEMVEKQMKLSLYINSIRSISFQPFFTFYRKIISSQSIEITIESISPSSLVLLNTKKMLNFKIKESFNQRSSIGVKYINEFNEIQQENCVVHISNIISCLSPSYDKISEVKIYFSINRGSDCDGGKKLQLYTGFILFI
jgi:hypothetical protein